MTRLINNPHQQSKTESPITKAIQIFLRLQDETWEAKISDRYKKGIPDVIVAHHGIFVGIEIKSETGKPSAQQIHYINLINSNGGIAGVCRSINDVIELLLKARKKAGIRDESFKFTRDA